MGERVNVVKRCNRRVSYSVKQYTVCKYAVRSVQTVLTSKERLIDIVIAPPQHSLVRSARRRLGARRNRPRMGSIYFVNVMLTLPRRANWWKMATPLRPDRRCCSPAGATTDPILHRGTLGLGPRCWSLAPRVSPRVEKSAPSSAFRCVVDAEK